MGKVIVDSDILILVSRGDATALSYLKNLEAAQGVAISAITAFELVIGSLNKSDLVSIKKFLSRFELLHLDQEISRTALRLLEQYNLSHGLLLPDSLIAASAIENDLGLATRNVRDFRFIADLRLIKYP